MPTYHVITIGCQMNKSDSERLAGRLEQNGYKRVDNKYQADLIVVNTCGVRQTAEDRIYGLIPEIKKANKKARIIITGCLAGRTDVQKRLKEVVDIWLPISEITNYELRPACRTGRITNKMPKKVFNRGDDDYLKVEPKRESEFSAFVPIGNGCDNFCSYCVVPYARGREVYRPVKGILGEVKNLVKKNYKEITLIAQNVNSYKSGKIDFADLLKMINNIKGDFWIRFMTSHPKDMSAKLIKTIAGCEKVCHQVHLPAQAGDDSVLEKMNRKYTKADYIKLVSKIRKILNGQIQNSKIQNSKLNVWRPPAAITTDIIVGFPGETKAQFNQTAKLMREIKFDLAYIAKYSVRPGTAAAKMTDNVVKAEKNRREVKLIKILRKTALENNKKYLGKIIVVLAEGESKSEEWIGKTKTNKNVKFPTRPNGHSSGRMTNDKINLIGQFVNIKIIKVQDFGLEGELIN